MAKVFSFNANKGSFYSEQQVLGVKTGTIPFATTRKGNAIKLSSAGNFTWTVPSITGTKMLVGIQGNGTVTITHGTLTTIVTATNQWQLQNITATISGISVIIAWTSGTVFISLLEFHSSPSINDIKATGLLFHRQTQKGQQKTNLLDRNIFNTKAESETNQKISHRYSYKQGSLLDIKGTLHASKSGSCFSNVTSYRVNGVNGIITKGNAGSVKALSFRIKPKTTTEYICEGTAGGEMISINAGTLTSTLSGGVTSTKYVNGVVGSTMVAGQWQTVTLVFSTAINMTALIVGKNNASYGVFDIEDFITWSSEPSAQEIKDYYNVFADLTTIEDNGIGEAVGNAPRNWIKGTTAAFTTEEVTTATTLPKGTKYRKLSTAGTSYIGSQDLAKLVNNGYADYWALVNGTWIHRKGLVDSAITTPEIAYASGRLTYTTANNNDGFTADPDYPFVIKNGVRV
jgi:hypothetical protein